MRVEVTNATLEVRNVPVTALIGDSLPAMGEWSVLRRDPVSGEWGWLVRLRDEDTCRWAVSEYRQKFPGRVVLVQHTGSIPIARFDSDLAPPIPRRTS